MRLTVDKCRYPECARFHTFNSVYPVGSSLVIESLIVHHENCSSSAHEDDRNDAFFRRESRVQRNCAAQYNVMLSPEPVPVPRKFAALCKISDQCYPVNSR